MSSELVGVVIQGSWQTLYMVTVASVFAGIIGIPLGVLLFVTRKGSIAAKPRCYQLLGFVVNIGRSIPFIILIIALVPFTRLIVGSGIGTTAAIVPLSLAAIPFVARIVENVLLEIPAGLIETGHALGASPWQIITAILIPESLVGIINGMTVTIVNLIGYSAMAGAVGGGGLGDVAIRYGYQRFNTTMMLTTLVMLVIFVQLVQWLGDYLAKHFTR